MPGKRLFGGRGRKGETPGAQPEANHVEPFRPEIPKALKTTKWIAIVVAGMAEVAEKLIERNQNEAYKEAGYTLGLYKSSLTQQDSLSVEGRETPIQTAAGDKAAFLYANRTAVRLLHPEQTSEANQVDSKRLLKGAWDLVNRSHEDPSLRTRLVGIAEQEWRTTAQRELLETAENLSETSISKAKKALDENTTGRLSDENRQRLLGAMPLAAKTAVHALSIVFPGTRILEHAVKEVGESLTENATLVNKTLHREDRFGPYFPGEEPKRDGYVGQLQAMAHERGIEVANGPEADAFAKLVAAVTLIDQMDAFAVSEGKVNVPADMVELVKYATIAGVLDERQSELYSQTLGAKEMSAEVLNPNPSTSSRRAVTAPEATPEAQ